MYVRVFLFGKGIKIQKAEKSTANLNTAFAVVVVVVSATVTLH